MEIREIRISDFDCLQELYLHLHETETLQLSNEQSTLWQNIVQDRNYHILVGEIDGKIISSVTLIVIPNLTRGAKPYAIIENVVTHTDYRNKGYARLLMQEASRIAESSGCYKIMLLTGSKKESTLKFYENCGFNSIDTNAVVKTDNFYAPVAKNKKGEYKMKAGQTVYLCFSTDFLIEEADEWRGECWEMIKERSDLHFIFLTKRIERFLQCIPDDWQDGYDNVTVGCTVENQRRADERLSIFSALPVKHRNIICQPLIEAVNIEKYLDNVELVVVGGESDKYARELNYEWVLSIREQCISKGVHFEFRQCGTHFIKDQKEYTLNVRDLCSQAKKADINC